MKNLTSVIKGLFTTKKEEEKKPSAFSQLDLVFEKRRANGFYSLDNIPMKSLENGQNYTVNQYIEELNKVSGIYLTTIIEFDKGLKYTGANLTFIIYSTGNYEPIIYKKRVNPMVSSDTEYEHLEDFMTSLKIDTNRMLFKYTEKVLEDININFLKF